MSNLARLLWEWGNVSFCTRFVYALRDKKVSKRTIRQSRGLKWLGFQDKWLLLLAGMTPSQRGVKGPNPFVISRPEHTEDSEFCTHGVRKFEACEGSKRTEKAQ
jgi:hypothetical protein